MALVVIMVIIVKTIATTHMTMYDLYTNHIKFMYDNTKPNCFILMSYTYYTYHWSTYVNIDYSQNGGNKAQIS
jgi:hypothetical protein